VDRARAVAYFAEALTSDIDDIQGGSAAEGVHLGAMGGTVDLVQRVCTGIEVTGGVLRLDPRLPSGIDRLQMRIRYRGHALDLSLTPEAFNVRSAASGASPIRLAFRGDELDLPGGAERTFALAADPRHDREGCSKSSAASASNSPSP
jgi:trehalose/maltose hydrolase-like predicted phosphorylase